MLLSLTSPTHLHVTGNRDHDLSDKEERRKVRVQGWLKDTCFLVFFSQSFWYILVWLMHSLAWLVYSSTSMWQGPRTSLLEVSGPTLTQYWQMVSVCGSNSPCSRLGQYQLSELCFIFKLEGKVEMCIVWGLIYKWGLKTKKLILGSQLIFLIVWRQRRVCKDIHIALTYVQV